MNPKAAARLRAVFSERRSGSKGCEWRKVLRSKPGGRPSGRVFGASLAGDGAVTRLLAVAGCCRSPLGELVEDLEIGDGDPMQADLASGAGIGGR